MAAPALDYLILGLLERGARTGYEIQRVFKQSPVNLGSRSFGSIYPALHRLEEQGLITSEQIPQEGRPGKHLARITGEGRAEFVRWLKEPLSPDDVMAGRDPFAERFLFFDCLAPEEALRLCREHLAQVEEARQKAADFMERFGGTLDRFARWNLQGGLLFLEARINWLQGICRDLE